MLFYRLRLGSSRGLFSSGLLTKFFYTFLFCLVRACFFYVSLPQIMPIQSDRIFLNLWSFSFYFPGQTNAENFFS